MLFAVAAIWGSGFIVSRMALDASVTPELLMMVRFSVATLVVGLFFRKRLKQKFKMTDLKGGIIIGLFLFLGFYIQIVGLQYTTPSNNAFLTATNVIMVPLIWWVLSKKRPGKKLLISSMLCLLGIGVLSLNFTAGFSFSWGDLLSLLCAFFFCLPDSGYQSPC